jgi:hypothetical protein
MKKNISLKVIIDLIQNYLLQDKYYSKLSGIP